MSNHPHPTEADYRLAMALIDRHDLYDLDKAIVAALTTAYAEGELAGYARGRAEALESAYKYAMERKGSYDVLALQEIFNQVARIAQGAAMADAADYFCGLASTPAGTGEPT